jgi:hypothetical protein
MKSAFRRVDLFFAGVITAGNVARDHANCIPPASRRKFHDPLQRVRVVDRLPPGRKASNGRGGAAVATLPRVRAEHVHRVDYGAVPCSRRASMMAP